MKTRKKTGAGESSRNSRYRKGSSHFQLIKIALDKQEQERERKYSYFSGNREEEKIIVRSALSTGESALHRRCMVTIETNTSTGNT